MQLILYSSRDYVKRFSFIFSRRIKILYSLTEANLIRNRFEMFNKMKSLIHKKFLLMINNFNHDTFFQFQISMLHIPVYGRMSYTDDG